MFILFAVAALLWSLSALAWTLGIRKRLARALLVLTSWLAAAVGAGSGLSDVRSIHKAVTAPRSDLDIHVIRRDDWWQVEYSRGDIRFITANELHVPAETAVDLTWREVQHPSIEHAVSLCRPDQRCVLVAEASASDARFVHLWPPMWRNLRVVAEPSDRFEQWFRNEAQVAVARSGNGPTLFESSGCGYCHVIRGVMEQAAQIAPDLTHVASRRTIAGTRFPLTSAYLMGWVVHSRGLKRGSRMPDNAIDPHVLHALIRYLESLR